MTRPTMYDEEITQIVAKRMTPMVASWLDFPGNAEITHDLREAFDNAIDWDAYRIARSLDDLGWRVDARLVGVLEEVESVALEEWVNAVRKWVKENNIKPTFKVGDMVQTKRSVNRFVGKVVKVDCGFGRYLVFCPALGHVREGIGKRGAYLNFEDAEPAPDDV